MTSTRFIEDPETLVSDGSAFKLGFFSLADSTNRYVGIWYSTPSLSTIIWVANRDKPLNDSSGLVTISEDGNLLVMNGQKEIFWSTNVSNAAANSSAQLLDSGNLVLRDNSGRITWESIQHPSHSFLPKMKISADTDSGEKVVLTSWKSPSDPSIGSFSLGMNPLNIPQAFVWNGSHPYWRSGPWNGQIFIGQIYIGVPKMNSVFLNGFGFQVVDDKAGTVYETFTLANSSIFLYYVLTPQGTVVETYREDGKEEWEVTWRSNNSECDVYGTCGAFGICNSGNSPICSCLRGYEPKYIEEWSRGNWTSGCVRKTPLQCERTNSSGQQGKLDGFFRLTTVKVPDFADWSLALEDECREQCLKNCSCMAYSYYSGIGCMSWSGNLIDLGKFTQGGADLYIRLANSELDKKRDMKAIISVTIVIGTIAIGIYTYFSWRWRRKQTVKDKSKEILLSDRGDAYQIYDMNRLGDNANQFKLEELPLLALEKLETATNNFHEANKLGQGGFGPVYRGKLPGGQEIAVKRLSRASAQGLEEFGNEVVVISKIQHRNLVRLLGYCIEGDEKLLIYEYMPNKSLDSFLFDPLKRDFLDWRRRFNIIEGIGRGLLYLHRDSRFRIIHRDLKASNILLDEDLTAKISDFGIARIVGGNQDQANTMRVVGTYGYMSPEYAMEGRFSEKSDVFSFGVLLLEIAWTLWCEHNIEELIDEIIAEEGFQEEISRCIHVGLLAVQELAKDRPSISTVVSMLSSEIAHLPPPKQPPFLEKQIESSQPRQNKYSSNQVTVTVIQGR
uniref:Receptor-like serine/threonine-protein kinase n=1 Tax=Vitis vinifera TaxID=29760 RepID=F6GZ95_VITVI